MNVYKPISKMRKKGRNGIFMMTYDENHQKKTTDLVRSTRWDLVLRSRQSPSTQWDLVETSRAVRFHDQPPLDLHPTDCQIR